MKFFHNDKMALGWAIFIEFVAHGFFAMQAFLLGGFLGEIALTKSIGPVAADWAGSLLLAVLIGGAAFQAFVLGEYMKQHVESYETTPDGDGSYRKSFVQTRWLVAGLEIASLLFRCGVVVSQGDTGQAVVTLVFGVILLWYAFAQAKVIHAVVNRPVTGDIIAARELAGKSIVTTALKNIPDMTVEQKRRYYDGDVSSVDEVDFSNYARQQEKLQPKEDKRRREREREDEKQRKLELAKEYEQKLLSRPTPQQQPFLKAVNKQDANGHRDAL